MTTLKFLFVSLILAAVSCPVLAAKQVTSFTYQGQLQVNGQPANGTFPVSFALFDAATAGNQIGTSTNTSVVITNGVFSAELNYPGAFNGTQLWLQIEINGQVLANRQIVSTTPVAQFALNGGVSLYLNANATSVDPPPYTTLATVGAVTFSASCGLSASNAVALLLRVSSSQGTFSLSEIVSSQFNDSGALTSSPVQGFNFNSTPIEYAVSSSGNYQRVWISPAILHSSATPPMTDAIQVYLVADARPTYRSCRIEGVVTPSF